MEIFILEFLKMICLKNKDFIYSKIQNTIMEISGNINFLATENTTIQMVIFLKVTLLMDNEMEKVYILIKRKI